MMQIVNCARSATDSTTRNMRQVSEFVFFFFETIGQYEVQMRCDKNDTEEKQQHLWHWGSL